MEANQLKTFLRVLKAQQTAAVHGLGEGKGIMAVERSPDEMDQTERAAEQELAIQGLNRRSKLLQNIQAALRRIEDRTFGRCIHCEEAIAQKRLAAVPWTPFCIRCQEAIDRSEVANREPAFDLDFHAA
jgi:DnaK suppressor protein